MEFGVENGRKGDINAAIGAFNQAIQIDPKFAPAYYNRGFAFMLQNRQAEAIADFTRSIQLDPTLADAYYRRGSLYGRAGNFQAAADDFNKIIKLDPNFGPAHYNRGHVLYFDGDLNGALGEINESIRLTPDSPYGYFIRGLINHAQDRRVEALSDFQKSLGLGYATAAFWIWIVETENGEHGSARLDLSTALGKTELFKPDDWAAQVGNFLLESITQDQLLSKAKADNPEDTARQECEGWFYVGMAKHFAGDAKGAHDCFTKAMATGAKAAEEYVEAQRQLAAEAQSP